MFDLYLRYHFQNMKKKSGEKKIRAVKKVQNGAYFLQYRLQVRKEDIKTTASERIVARYIASLPYNTRVAGMLYRWLAEDPDSVYSAVSVSLAFPKTRISTIVDVLKRFDAVGLLRARQNRYTGQIDYQKMKSTFKLISECRNLFPHLTDSEYILLVGYPYSTVTYRLLKIITAAKIIEYGELRRIARTTSAFSKVNAFIKAGLVLTYMKNGKRVVQINIHMLKRLYMIVQALDSNFVIEDEIIASINSSENFK